MPETRDFHLGDILSVTDGHLVSPRHMDGVYDIMNWLTGESLYTHQLVLAREECRTELLRQHPQLAEVDSGDEMNAGNWREWLARMVEKYGETLPVAPLPKREAKYDSPIGDLVEMLDGDTSRITVVEP
jgi:hypothetical protein